MASLSLLTVAIAVMVVYAGLLGHPLTLDDRALISLNPAVTGQAPLNSIWNQPLLSDSDELSQAYRPLLTLALRLQWRAWGDSPSSFHAFSLLLFLGVVVVFMLVAARWIHRPSGRMTALAVMAVHPMATQGLLEARNQGALLALLAMLGACLAAMQWRRGAWRAKTAAVVMAACQAVAIGAHEMGAVLPIWLAGLAWLAPMERPAPEAGIAPRIARQRRRHARRDDASMQAATASPPENVLEESPFHRAGWMIAGVMAAYAIARSLVMGSLLPSGGAIEQARQGLTGGPLALGESAIALALKRLAWPTAPTLLYVPAKEAGTLPSALLGWVGLLVLAGALAWAARRWKPMAWGLVLLLTPLLALAPWLPTTVIFSEAPLLFVLPGLGMILGAGVEKIAGGASGLAAIDWRERAVATLLIVVAGAMAWQDWLRVRQWADETTLWRAEAAMHPTLTLPLINLIVANFEQGRFQDAKDVVARARKLGDKDDWDAVTQCEIRLDVAMGQTDALRDLLEKELQADRSHDPGFLEGLADVAYSNGMKELVPEFYRKALKQNPKSFLANFQLAKVEFQAKHNKEALALATKAAGQAPPDRRVSAFLQLAEILTEMGYYREALAQYEEVRKLDPSLEAPYLRLGQFYWGRKEYDRAEATIVQGLGLAKVQTYAKLAGLYFNVLAEQGRARDGVDWLKQQANNYPSDAPLQLLVAETLVRFGDDEAARQIYESLSNLSIEDRVKQLVGLGKIAFGADRDPDRALALWKQALQLSPGNAVAQKLIDMIEKKNAAPSPTPSSGPVNGAPANGRPVAPVAKLPARATAQAATKTAQAATSAPARSSSRSRSRP
jgi:tetratricopeptide (TPR) repeat protein